MAHKITITSLSPLSAVVWPTLHQLHTSYSLCLFLHPHKLLLPSRLPTGSLTAEQIQAVQMPLKIKSLYLYQSCKKGSIAAVPAASWRQRCPIPACPSQHTAADREHKRKDKVSQEPKHLSVALLFILLFILNQGDFCKLTRQKGSP